MMRNIQEALTIIENKAKVRTCRNKPQVSSSGGSSIQNDAITAFTKQVEALVHHISSMQKAYNRNQVAPIQLTQTQMGRLDEAFQKRPLEEEEEPKTITEVVEIASSKSTPLFPPLETPPLSTPKPKEDLEPNPRQPLIPYPSRLQEEKFQALENPTGRADHFVYRIDIVDSLCDKLPIENNSLSGNPTPSSDLVVESLSSFPIPFRNNDSLLEETDTLLSQIDDSFPEYETFCFNIEEKSSGSTTSHSNHSLPEYESFCFDYMEGKSSGSTTTHSDYSFPDYDAFYFDDNQIEEKSSGSTTTHSDFSLPEYDSFIFDLSINPFPPADRSVSYHEEFADELAHIISQPEYNRFYFDLKVVPGDFTRVLRENIFDLSTKGLTINDLNDSSLLLSDCDSSLSKEFSEIDLLISFYGNEDIIFDPGIFIIEGVQSERLYILPLDDFSTISFVSDSLLLTDHSEIKTYLSFPSGNEDKVFEPEIFIIDGVFSFTRKSPHLLIDNFLIDKCHILSEISLKIVSFICFHPKDKEIQGELS
ncbi:hypothetical protein Tco_0472345 [Tanacetum coccineum]